MNRVLLVVALLLAPSRSTEKLPDDGAHERRRQAIVRMNEAVEVFTSADPGPTIEALEAASALDLSYAGPHINLARIHARAGHLDAAEHALGHALELVEAEPARFDPSVLRAEILHDLGRLHLARAEGLAASGKDRRAALREAASAFERAAEPLAGAGAGAKRPRLAYLAEHQRGLALDALGDAVEADRSYRACIALQPNYAPCWTDLARLYLEFGEAATAELVLERATQAFASDAALWLGLAELRLAQNRHKQALEAATKAKELDPYLADVYYVLGMAEAELRSNDQAVQHLKGYMHYQTGQSEVRVGYVTDVLFRLMH